MTDLVDYLRDKLEHADDVVCICPDVWLDPLPPAKGWSRNCVMHGRQGPGPENYVVRSNVDPDAPEPITKTLCWWRR